MPRPSKPLLTRRGIADEALALVEEEGIEALTTRRLAKRLGVEGPSLYNHVARPRRPAGRDDRADRRAGRHVAARARRLARRASPAFARSYRRAFAAHPHIVATDQRSRPVRTDVALRAYDQAFAAFERFGWDGHTAAS